MRLDDLPQSDNIEDRRGDDGGGGGGGFPMGMGGRGGLGIGTIVVLGIIGYARGTGAADAQWKVICEQAAQRYRPPTLVMFAGQTRADACGQAQSAMGPFYCPADQKIYLDTSFFRRSEERRVGKE